MTGKSRKSVEIPMRKIINEKNLCESVKSVRKINNEKKSA